MVGSIDGSLEALLLGKSDGARVGLIEGSLDGSTLGIAIGSVLGIIDGKDECTFDGE